MKKRLFFLLSLLIILSLALTSAAVGQTPTAAPDRPARNLQEVPAEVQALFKDGMPISEFLALNKGPVPRALAEFSDQRVTVVLEMEGEPLAAVYRDARQLRSPMSATAQQQYVTALREAQAPVVARMAGMGATVISQYTKAYNGILVNLPVASLAEVQRLPGVKAVRRAPLHRVNLENSVPLIRADEVVSGLGYDGTGITIAVIDTGIDYHHAALGGSGDPAHYTGNNPDTIEGGLYAFPTAKVIGGYDFAGTNYNASSDDPLEYTPVPDADPLDEDGHGTHVASTAAGIGATGTIGVGVAPEASLYALKVFGVSGSTNLVVDAIEWAMDPNGDSNLDDHVDVINMSLGAPYPSDPADPSVVASDMASSIGVVVVASAGNEGNTSYITGSPGVADSVISVAASTTGFVSGPLVSVQPGGTPSTLYLPSTFDGNTGHYNTTITAPLFDAGTLSVPDTLCDITGVTPNVMSGDIALIQRGDCDFTTKVNNAGTLGAVGALIYNHAAGGDSLVLMGGDPVTIPAGFIGYSAGVTLTGHHGDDVEVSAEDLLTTLPDPNVDPDTIADFSSRGPRGVDSILKPDIAAPGEAIVAAKMGGGDAALSLSGTSMAAPHVAGVAALVLDANPSWTPEQVKAAIMNTAVDLADPFSAQTPLQGAGRVDAYETVTAGSFLVGDPDRVSLNWGLVSTNANVYTDTTTLELTNLDPGTKAYTTSWDFGPGSNVDGFDMTLPSGFTVPGGPITYTIPVDLNLDTTQMFTDFWYLEEYYGTITVTNAADSTDTMRIPFYSVVQPYAELSLAGTVTELFHPAGEVEITQTAPITSFLWTYPLLAIDPNEPTVADEADLRLFGMDYGWDDATYGEIFVPAFNTYGAWHTPQPYFTEIDMDFDLDNDGVIDLTDFNFNYGWWLGTDDTDEWIVVQIDWTVGLLFLGSPYLIYTDYNAGFMEWYLPAGWHYLDASGDTDFAYEIYSFDSAGNGDFGGSGEFDYTKLPFLWDLSTFEPGPGDNVSTLTYEVDDPAGYALASPLGLMVVDYNGQGGAGQAYIFETPLKIHLPVMHKQ
jgi:minor extracellular serine protease Vpr